jgi:hypothetical protein
MFVPPYTAILRAIGTSRNVVEKSADVKIPVTLFKFLLKSALSSSGFDEKAYLATNPDVAEAIRSGAVPGALEHYINYGYFESRRGAASPAVDEVWYRNANPDVATAIRSGQLSSAQEHFDVVGAEEFRVPNRTSEKDIREWKNALGKAVN